MSNKCNKDSQNTNKSLSLYNTLTSNLDDDSEFTLLNIMQISEDRGPEFILQDMLLSKFLAKKKKVQFKERKKFLLWKQI